MNFREMTVSELKAECKARGITGYSSLKKAELVDCLSEHVMATKIMRPNEPEPKRVLLAGLPPSAEPKEKPKGPAFRYAFKGRDRKRNKGKHNRNAARRSAKRQKKLRKRKGMA